jgi:putative oxidoreductase
MIRFLARQQPWALTLIRLALGIALVFYSWNKVYPQGGFHHGNYLAPEQHFNDFVAHLGLPRWLGYISTATEFLGGICLLLGLLTRFWAFLATINMLVAIFTVNIHHGYSGSEFSISLAVMAFLLLTTGAGKLALDRRLGLA